LGFDETNNGFHLPHAPFMIVTGVLGREGSRMLGYPCSNKSNRKFFGSVNPPLGKVARYARTYLSEYSRFFYTIIPQPQEIGKPYSINLIEAQAISVISLRFFREFNLQGDTQIYIHQVGGKGSSEFVENQVINTLKYGGVSSPSVRVVLSSKEEKQKEVIRCADMTGYYLAALKIFAGKEEWPFRSRQVPLNSLDNLIG
jgi:hypothetical protein